jgi:hypothetical protein
MGIAVIALGPIFTLDNLEIVDGRDVIRFWSAALIADGVSHLDAAARAAAIAILRDGTKLPVSHAGCARLSKRL